MREGLDWCEQFEVSRRGIYFDYYSVCGNTF